MEGGDPHDGRGCQQRPVLRGDGQKEGLVIDGPAGIVLPPSALAFPLLLSPNPLERPTWSKIVSHMT